MKNFFRAKPIRGSYKNGALASSFCSYPFKFEIYAGTELRRDQPLGPYIVRNLISIIENSRQHCECFDNFFTSYLLIDLKEKQFYAPGMFRKNRLMKCSMARSIAVQKKERGFYDSYSDKNVVLVQ